MVELIKQNYLENKNKFEQTKVMLTKKLGNNVPVNHVGSTAIPEIEVGKNIIDVPAYKRNINTVFQKYALFPHLNVFENILFSPI